MKEYEKAGVILRPSHQWEIDLFDFPPENIGDCISYMMWKACFYPEYAKYIPICYELLRAGKRWPDELNHPRIAKTKLQYGLSKIWHWVRMIPVMGASNEKRGEWIKKHKVQRLYRTQHGMTRDPYIYFWAACEINDMWFYIELVNMPHYLRRRLITAWRMYIITGNQKYKDRYERIQLRQLWQPKRQFAMDLVFIRAWAAASQVVMDRLKEIEPLPNKG